MYTAFFGLREKPFSLSPDPHFLYLAGSHREALAHVLYGVEQGEGFIAVTGEVGTGKTTLCRTLLQRLGSDTEVAYIFNPTLSAEELLRAISIEFGLITEGRTRAELSDQLNQFLLEMKRDERRVLLIIDEAQNLGPATLEEIRLLSNLETATSKLIQILLFGQPELDEMLDSKGLRQLRQRIGVRWSLSPLTAGEVRAYVRHRLRIAAGGECDLFTERAVREIRRRARGIPRLVNLLADRALLAGYAAGIKRIGPDLVNRAAREILSARAKNPSRKLLRRGVFATAVLAGAAVVGAAAWYRFSEVDRSPRAESPAVQPPVASGPSPALPEASGQLEGVGSQVDDGVDAPPDPDLEEGG